MACAAKTVKTWIRIEQLAEALNLEVEVVSRSVVNDNFVIRDKHQPIIYFDNLFEVALWLEGAYFIINKEVWINDTRRT